MDFLQFLITSCMLGVGLAMDAFSVSVANGMGDPGMSKKRQYIIAGTFAGFQFLMPMIGWLCVHTIVTCFRAVDPYIPWIALILLTYIGGKMILEGIQQKGMDEPVNHRVGAGELIVQGIATSIDALSVGFTIADYPAVDAFIASLIIAAVTFLLCMIGLRLGRKAGDKLTGRASVAGGIILILIGLKIVFTH
ncbi:MAG: manganese efflux pump [Solobacterium sp.]|nr:manganese efflux pump [Solobacterium sp.]